MADVKGKGVEIESIIQVQYQQLPASQEVGFQKHFDEYENRVGALRRLSEMRSRRRQTTNASGSSSAVRRQSIPKPIRPPPPPTTVVNPFTAQFLFKKELKCSDVGAAGRIIIPKGYAERYLPVLTDKGGVFVFMDDIDAFEIWAFRYRYWQNNRSRMFVLEKTGDFVKAYGLQSGDFIMIYKDILNDRYGIRARKAISQEIHPPPPLHEVNRSMNFQQYHPNLVARDEIASYFPPENNITNNFPMNFPAGGSGNGNGDGGVVPDVSNFEQPLNFQSINTFSPGNFW